MSNTTPIKAVQNSLRKHKLQASASDIREAAHAIGVDINSEDAIELLVMHFTENNDDGKWNDTGELAELDVNEAQLMSLDTSNTAPSSTNLVVQEAKELLIQEIGSDFLNVELDKDAIVTISSQINLDLQDIKAARKQVITAIQGYIQYQINLEKEEATQSTRAILTAYKEGVAEYNKHLNSLASQVTKGLEVNQQARKSDIDKLLEQFRVPASKA